MGLLLAIDRRIPDNVADLRAGRWNKKAYGKADGLLGSTLGILGLGSIGLGVAERAAAFGIKVQALDKPDRRGVRRVAGRRPRDHHVRLAPGPARPPPTSSPCTCRRLRTTRHLVDESFLGRMRPGAILLNTSRGDVIDEDALLEALDAGAVRAGLDVYDGRTRQRHGGVGVGAGPSTRPSSAPTTSAPPPSRPSSPPPPAWSRSSTRSPRARRATA